MEKERKKPVILVLGPHGVEHVKSSLKPYKKAITTMLRSQPTGRVAVFAENADGTLEVSNRIREFVRSGGIPSIANLTFLSIDGRPATRLESLVVRLLTRKKNSYTEYQTSVLASLAKKFPGRIDLIWEGRTGIDGEAIEREYDQSKENIRKFITYGFQGNFTEGIPLFQQVCTYLSNTLRNRDPNVALQMEIALQEPDIVGGVIGMGTGHSQIGRLLNTNYDVHSIFSEKNNNTHIFSPKDEIVRRLYLKPDEQITRAQWEIAFTREVLYNYAYAQLFPVNEQQLLRRIWSATKDFTAETVRQILIDIKAEGIDQVADDLGLLDELPREHRLNRLYSIFRAK